MRQKSNRLGLVLFVAIHCLRGIVTVVGTEGTVPDGECDSEGEDCQYSDSVKQVFELKQNGLNGSVTMSTLEDFPSPRESVSHINIIREIASSGLHKEFGMNLLEDKQGTGMETMAEKYSDDSVRIVTETFNQWTLGNDGRSPITWATLVRCLHEIGLSTLADDIENFFGTKEKPAIVSRISPSQESCAKCLCYCVPSLWKSRDEEKFTTVCLILQHTKILVDDLIHKSGIEEAGTKLEEMTLELDRLIKRLLEQHVRIGIIGLTKAGKSTFLNALLGRSFLPTSVQPQTANETVIIHDMSKSDGELHCIVDQKRNKSHQLATGEHEIFKKLERFNKEKRDHGQTSEKCAKLVLYAPLKFLASSEIEDITLEFSDTPGFGEAMAEKEYAEANNTMKELCAFILILNSQNMRSESELNLLKKLRKYHPELLSELNRVLIFVNGHENVYRDKKLTLHSASVTPEEVPEYISNYFKRPDFLNISIPPEKIILFNALWALRSREWRRDSILKKDRKTADILYTDALQMLKYIGRHDDADKLKDMSEESVNTTISLLETFSQIENIEGRLRQMVVKNGGLILLESSADDTSSVINNSIVPAITNLKKDERVKTKKDTLQSVEETDRLFEGLFSDIKVDLYSSLVSLTRVRISSVNDALQKSLEDIFRELLDNFAEAKQWTKKDAVVKEILKACDSVPSAALAQMKKEWQPLSTLIHTTAVHQLSRAFLALRASFSFSIDKIDKGENNSDLHNLILDLESSSTVPDLLVAASDNITGCTLALSPLPIDELKFSGMEDNEAYIHQDIRGEKICDGGYFGVGLFNTCHVVYRFFPNALQKAFNGVVKSWTNLFNEQVEKHLKNIPKSAIDTCAPEVSNILKEPHQRVLDLLDTSQRALDKAKQNVLVLKKTEEELEELRQALREIIKK